MTQRQDDGFTAAFLAESVSILRALAPYEVDAVVTALADTRDRGGRLFLAGSGGGAGHASHAACDFRKLAGFEAYCVSDNVSELTARVNDEGWGRAYADWLGASRIGPKDCLMVFSVGGGDEARGISPNLVNAMLLARSVGASIVGVAGRDGGALRRLADASILVPVGEPANVTAQTESMQALLWHLMVMHPALLRGTPKWESMDDATRPAAAPAAAL